MGVEIPQPADDEFEERLSWAPRGEPVRRELRQRTVGRRSAPTSNGRSEVPDDRDVREMLHELRQDAAELKDGLAEIRSELAAVATVFQELIKKDPLEAATDPERSAREIRRAIPVRLRSRSAESS